MPGDTTQRAIAVGGAAAIVGLLAFLVLMTLISKRRESTIAQSLIRLLVAFVLAVMSFGLFRVL